MIISGLQTGNTRWLAAHLQNAADNETIEIAEITGTVSTDIDGALAEFDAIAAGTRAKEGVYAAFINPPVPLSRDQYMQAIALIEDRLGLSGQPRIVLFHTKTGRQHCHIVWSRIDWRAIKAIHLSHDRQKLRRCAQELGVQFGFELPPGLARDRGAERFKNPPRITRAEKAMQAQSGLSREVRRRVITDCYRNSDSAEAFVNALEAAGYMLARGDKRVFVVVDIAGDVHSLARQIDGAKTKDVTKKLAGLTLSLLPPVERAKALMLQRAAAQQDAMRADEKKKAAGKAERERLDAVQRKRRLALDLLWQAMKVRHMHERKVLLAHFLAERQRRIARRHWLAVGLAIYLKKIAFIRQLVEYYEKRRKRTMEEQHQALMASVRRRHENEAAELRRRYAALDRLERRENATLFHKFGDIRDADEFGIHRAISSSGKGSAHFAPSWTSLIENAADVTHPPRADFIAAIRENTTDILAQTGPPPAELAGFAAAVPASLSGYGLEWLPFVENASDITGPRADPRLIDDSKTLGHLTAPSHSSFPAWPGAG